VFSSMSVSKSSRLRSSVAVCAAVAGCGLAAVSSASASTLAVDAAGTIRFTAARGEVNAVNATDVGSGDTIVFTDPGSRMTVGNGCVPVGWHEGRCTEQLFQDLVVDLGDRDDTARVFTLGLLGRVRVTGGSGDDTIEDSPQTGAEVSGGTGEDTILVHPNSGGSVDVHGDWGNDTITAVSGSGVVNGDAGDDEITLTSFIDLPGGTSAAYGGFGDDRITANGVTFMSLLDGGFGDDTITTTGFAIVSVLNGGFGRDAITARPDRAEEINGGAGRDVIDGGGGADTIDCGFGFDRYAVYEGDTTTRCEFPFTPSPGVNGAL
jgi:Ca2+-binding RTX toxin-like protein